MLKTRSRIVNFRISEDEMRQLMVASMENGASCLSSYLRTVMLQAIEDHHYRDVSAGNGKEELQVLKQRVGLAEQRIAKLESMASRLASDDCEHTSMGAAV
jgi:hypothetical protein